MTRRAVEPLYLTEGEIALRLGLSAAEWVAIAPQLERTGLPFRDPIFKNRRYWPAVRAYLDRRAGLMQQDSRPIGYEGEEHWAEDNRRLRSKKQPAK